jgi:hypothetical protein
MTLRSVTGTVPLGGRGTIPDFNHLLIVPEPHPAQSTTVSAPTPALVPFFLGGRGSGQVSHGGTTEADRNIREFRDRVAEHYGKEAVQLTFYLPKRQSTDVGATASSEAPQAGYEIDLDDDK